MPSRASYFMYIERISEYKRPRYIGTTLSLLLTSPLAKSFNVGLQVRSFLTSQRLMYTGSKDCLNVTLEAAIDILFYSIGIVGAKIGR